MKNGKAKIITPERLASVILANRDISTHPDRDEAVLYLSFRAGLRAQEIALLEWDHVISPEGAVGVVDDQGNKCIYISKSIGKGGKERTVPMHPDVERSLRTLYIKRSSKTERVIFGDRKRELSPNSLQQMLRRLYLKHGLKGCSSHSGRRTFITTLARTHGDHHCSLLDVQVLAGHSNLKTTARYIEPSTKSHRMISSL